MRYSSRRDEINGLCFSNALLERLNCAFSPDFSDLCLHLNVDVIKIDGDWHCSQTGHENSAAGMLKNSWQGGKLAQLRCVEWEAVIYCPQKNVILIAVCSSNTRHFVDFATNPFL